MELMQAYSGGDSSSFLPSLASSISTSA